MREMGISAVYPGPNLSKQGLKQCVYPYLLKGLTVTRADQVWGIDLTYIRLVKGWMYLVAILDWYSRYVVAWRLDQTLEIPFVLEAVREAFARQQPEILNSDQGSHFISPQYTSLLVEAGVSISMDGRGRALEAMFLPSGSGAA